MPQFTLRLDMRAPAFGTPKEALYTAGLEMAEWADRQGFAECMLSEHHGSEDSYLPSPLIYAAAIAARTRRMRLQVSALVLPLHDPLRIAEDVAVLDNLSGGRVELVIAGGFLPSEFEMFGHSPAERGARIEQGIETLKQAWTGEAFRYRGRRARVRPTPLQKPHPPLLLGGSSKLSARRAARIADGYVPAVPELYALYRSECQKLGKEAAAPRTVGSFSLFVAEDPDATWAKIAPHALHESRSYARWYVEGNASGPYQDFESSEALRASQLYQVLTPEECIGLAQQIGPQGWLYLHPLVGGLDPAVGWESLELLASKVMPRL
jgi:alkanesulfonate monooxygenase SsuD/methylene tetrahydromethanopterin reductase-like flavin-dependent oxidoreductase (luciferase family)